MASSIVKGCPDECLSVLVDLSSNTTILGPASKIELLEDGEERQVSCSKVYVLRVGRPDEGPVLEVLGGLGVQVWLCC